MAVVKKTGKLLTSLIAVMAGIVLIAALAMVVLQIKPAIVMSGSMEPTIHTGSLVLINTKDKEVEEGDIIAFQRGDVFVTHRVAGIKKDGYLTKGDANESADTGIVKRDQLVGKTLFSLSHAGFILHALQSTWGLIAIACVLLLLLLGREVASSKAQGFGTDREKGITT